MPSIEEITTRFESSRQQIYTSTFWWYWRHQLLYKPINLQFGQCDNIVENERYVDRLCVILSEITFYRLWNIIINSIPEPEEQDWKIEKWKMFRADTVVRVRLFFADFLDVFWFSNASIFLLMCSFYHQQMFHNTIPFFSNIFVWLIYNL